MGTHKDPFGQAPFFRFHGLARRGLGRIDGIIIVGLALPFLPVAVLVLLLALVHDLGLPDPFHDLLDLLILLPLALHGARIEDDLDTTLFAMNFDALHDGRVEADPSLSVGIQDGQPV